MKKRIKLTPELENQILAAIRAGGFPHVAAAAFGVPKEVLDGWIDQGTKRKRKIEPFTSFARKLDQAQATARLAAEMKCHTDDPRLWLRSGSGRRRRHRPAGPRSSGPRCRTS